MGGEHHVRHPDQGMVGREVLADEVIEAGAGEVSMAQGRNQGVGVVQLRPSGVEVHGAGAHGRNAVFYGSRAIDRSPCGTGTSARLAHLHAKGRLRLGEVFVHESYIGSHFIGRIEEKTRIGNRAAIVPSIEGSAIATGFNQIWIDDEDQFARGFQVT